MYVYICMHTSFQSWSKLESLWESQARTENHWPELAVVRRILGQEPIGKDFLLDIREDFSPKDHQAVSFFLHATWTIPIHQTVLVEAFLRGCPRLAQLWDAHKTISIII